MKDNIVRLWTLDPLYLDAKGIRALWCEALLAQKIILGETEAYKNHPQMVRFLGSYLPLASIGYYLTQVHKEAQRRNYKFKLGLVVDQRAIPVSPLRVTKGQVEFEWNHLLKKLEKRSPARYNEFKEIKEVITHPLFYITEGPKEDWELGQMLVTRRVTVIGENWDEYARPNRSRTSRL